MELNWRRLVEERNAWVAHNFPREVDGRPGLGSMFGVIEELGELTHAHLKEDQQIRGQADEHQEAAKDSIGDLTVYLLGLMHLWKCTPEPPYDPVETRSAHWALLRLTESVGRLSYEFRSGFLGNYTIGWAVYWMKEYCRHRSWDYEQIVQDTWDHVKQRDWIKYPENGLPPIPRSEIDEVWEEATWDAAP